MKKQFNILLAALLTASLVMLPVAPAAMADEVAGDDQTTTQEGDATEDPTEPTDPTDPTEPTDPTDPTEPTDPEPEPDPEPVYKAPKITGIKTSYTKKVTKTIKDTITVKNGNGRKLYLQQRVDGKWKNRYKVKTSNDAKQKLTITYPDQWKKKVTTKWRFLIYKKGDKSVKFTKTVVIKAERRYQNPKGWLKIKANRISIDGGDYTLKLGYMGLKVKKVNNYFGIGSSHWPRYTSTTKYYVKQFQRENGIKATGNVNYKTWKAMGFSKNQWNTLGAYTSPLQVNLKSTRSDCVNAMIERAKDYLGAPYVVGASGTPSQGCDCSGLVMQAMYAAGVSPEPTNVVRHSHPGYEYESANLYENSKLHFVSYANKKPGDLVFYGGGSVTHVALYIGNGLIIESTAATNNVRITGINNSEHPHIMGIKRVFK